MSYGYVLHDDSLEILANPRFYPFNAASLRQIWSEPDFSRIYIPMNYTLLGILAEISRWWAGQDGLAQPNPAIYHAAGLILHVLNSLMVFRMLCGVTGKSEGQPYPFLALVGALFFALHPAQVESVARAGNITITFGGFLAMGSLLLFIKSLTAAGGGRVMFWMSMVLFLLALLTRPTVVALPLVALLAGLAGNLAPRRVLMMRLLPWMVLSACYTGISLWFQPPAPEQQFSFVALYQRLMISADCLMWYVSQTLWPAVLSVDHGRTPQAVLSSQFVWLSALGILALGLALVVSAKAGHRWLAAGGGVFLVMLVAVSGLVPSANREGMSIVYDRHLYVPLAAAAVVLVRLLGHLRRDWQLVCGIVPLCFLGMQTRSYQKVWAGSIPLFQHVVRVNPASWYGHGQLGTALLMEGYPAEAVPAFTRALEQNPQLDDARVNLGLALIELGLYDDAEKVLLQAVASSGFQENVHNNLAVVYLYRKAWAEAEKSAREALRINPRLVLAEINLALALVGQKQEKDAMEIAQRIVKDHPGFARGWRTLAEILFQIGRKAEAGEALQRAVQLEPANQDWQRLLQSWLQPPTPVNAE